METKLTKLLQLEIKRQQETIDLIASENIVSKDIMALVGSPFLNKYSEGYPGKRYYPGNIICDLVEDYARTQAVKVFGLDPKSWFANVQAYSGSPANQAIYFALAKPKDKVMGMSLAHGGHLTHGHKVNFSGTFYTSIQYHINTKTGFIDYEELGRLAKKHKPVLIFSGYTAYPRKIDFKRIGQIAHSIGAIHVADISHIAGLIAAKVHPSPFKHADVVMMTTHKTMQGPRGAIILSKGQEVAKKIDKAIMPGLQGGPHNNQTAGIARMLELVQEPSFKHHAAQIIKNAKTLALELKRYGFNLVSGGTDNHLLLIDLKNKNLTGNQAEKLLEASGILANRNSIPGDEKPFNPSGIRLGSPSITNRGMKVSQMKTIAKFMHHLIDLKEPPEYVNKEVVKLAKQFPLPY